MKLDRLSLCVLSLCLVISTTSLSAAAQTFEPIGDIPGYPALSCALFSDGSRFLASNDSTGYTILDAKKVKAQVRKEKQRITKKVELLNSIKSDIRRSQPRGPSVRKFIGLLSFFFGGLDIPEYETQDQRIIALTQLQEQIKTRRTLLNVILARINGCPMNKGNSQSIKGQLVSVTQKVIALPSISGSNAYGGYFYSTPGTRLRGGVISGFNGCLKTFYPDGGIYSSYVGFGDEPCTNRAQGHFPSINVQQCKDTISMPKGYVGRLVQVASILGGDQSGIDSVYNNALSRKPQVLLLKLPSQVSYDEGLRICEKFRGN